MIFNICTAFCTILAILVSGSLAEDADLSITQFTISSPDPSQTSAIYNTDTNVNVVLATFYVSNGGPDTLAAASSGNNYDVKMYLSDGDSMSDPQEVTTFTFTDSSGNRANSLNSGATHFYLAQNFDLNYPSNLCPTHSHVCLQVEKESGAVYTDADSSNDYQCLEFIDGSAGTAAGFTNCSSDPVPSNLTVVDSYTFTFNQEVNVTMRVDVENQGGSAVDGSTVSEDNIAFSSVFLASSQSESATYLEDFSDTLSYTYSDVSAGIDPWSETSYSGIKASITLPDTSCSSYQYLCLVFALGVNASFGDTTSNNLVCAALGDPATGGIGETVCPLVTTFEPTVNNTVASYTVTVGQVDGGSDGYVSIHGGVIAVIVIICILVGAGAALLLEFSVKKCMKRRREKKNAVSAITVQQDGAKDVEADSKEKKAETDAE